MIAWCPHCEDLVTASQEVEEEVVEWCSRWSLESVLRNIVAAWNDHSAAAVVVWYWSYLVYRSWSVAVNCCSLGVMWRTDEASSWPAAGVCCTWWHWSGLGTGQGEESSTGTGHLSSCMTSVIRHDKCMMIAWLLTSRKPHRGLEAYIYPANGS